MSDKEVDVLDIAKQRRINYGVVFNTVKGHDVLIDIITMCHILEPAINLDPQSLAFREGERKIGLEILKILNVDPKKYIYMVEETSSDAG